jgi:KDO2-lipid IV(A) lauroyltransferase
MWTTGDSRRCGIDTVEIQRIRRLLDSASSQELLAVFSARELSDCGNGKQRFARLAARFAAKEACLKLFAKETALGAISFGDFEVRRNGYGAPEVSCSERAQAVLRRHLIGAISVSLTHSRAHATAIAIPEKISPKAPLLGRLIYHLLPARRSVILENLNRVYGDVASREEIKAIAQAHYAHLLRLFFEFCTYPWIPRARKAGMARIENKEAILKAHAQGKGVIILAGHLGNFEIATAAGMAQFSAAWGRFYFVRRPIKSKWLDALVTRRFQAAGLRVLPNSGSLDSILDRLAAGDVIVFPFDQHAGPKRGLLAEFFGHPAGTFRSLALIALASQAPVLPGTTWRDENGQHVLRFEEPLRLMAHADPGEEIRLNTRLFNATLERMILRHPEQWWWVHKRWKPEQFAKSKRKTQRRAPRSERRSASGG